MVSSFFARNKHHFAFVNEPMEIVSWLCWWAEIGPNGIANIGKRGKVDIKILDESVVRNEEGHFTSLLWEISEESRKNIVLINLQTKECTRNLYRSFDHLIRPIVDERLQWEIFEFSMDFVKLLSSRKVYDANIAFRSLKFSF